MAFMTMMTENLGDEAERVRSLMRQARKASAEVHQLGTLNAEYRGIHGHLKKAFIELVKAMEIANRSSFAAPEGKMQTLVADVQRALKE
jgi:hypothetical protein